MSLLGTFYGFLNVRFLCLLFIELLLFETVSSHGRTCRCQWDTTGRIKAGDEQRVFNFEIHNLNDSCSALGWFSPNWIETQSMSFTFGVSAAFSGILKQILAVRSQWNEMFQRNHPFQTFSIERIWAKSWKNRFLLRSHEIVTSFFYTQSDNSNWIFIDMIQIKPFTLFVNQNVCACRYLCLIVQCSLSFSISVQCIKMT